MYAHGIRNLENAPRLTKGLVGLAVSLFVAILIWFFGTYIFLPQAPATGQIFGFATDQVVSAIILVALLIAIVRILTSIREVSGAIADMVAGPDEAGRAGYRRGLKALFYLIFALVAYVLIFAFLGNIYPPLRGVALVVLAIWVGLFLFQIGGTFSRWVERATQAVAQAVEHIVE